MKNYRSALAAITILSAGTVFAQGSVSVAGWVSPSSVNTAVVLPLSGPFSLEAGALLTYEGRLGLFTSVEAIGTVPVDETFPVKVTPFYGGDVNASMKFNPFETSYGGSAFIGAEFPISENWNWYFLTGPTVTFFPNQSITFGGAAQLGISYAF